MAMCFIIVIIVKQKKSATEVTDFIFIVLNDYSSFVPAMTFIIYKRKQRSVFYL